MRIKDKVIKFNIFECKFNVFEYKFNNFPLWNLIRTDIYKMIFINSNNNNSNNKISNFPNKYQLIKKIFNILIRIFLGFIYFYKIFLFKNIFFIDSRKNTFLYNKIYNSYIELILKKEKLDINKTLIIERDHKYNLNSGKYKYKHVLPIDFILFLGFLYSFIRKQTIIFFPFQFLKNKLNYKQYKNIKQIYCFRKSLLEFSYFFEKIFLKKKIKIFFYLQESFFYFFHFNKKNKYEIQHGIIPNIKIGYIYSDINKILYFIKDKNFLVYDKQSKNILISGGYESKNIKVIGKPEIKFYLNNKKEKISKIQNSVLIIEQPIDDFYKILYDLEIFAKNNKNYIFGIKIHPGSNFNYKGNIFKILDSDIYELLEKYEYIISLNSTVIYEARFFGCKIITTYKEDDISFKDYVKPLIGNYKLHVHIESGLLKSKKIKDLLN